MLRVKDILTDLEHLEIARLRIRIKHSNSIYKSNQYYNQIEEIVRKALERYKTEMA